MEKNCFLLAVLTVLGSALSNQFIDFSGQANRCSGLQVPNSYDIGPMAQGDTLTLRLEFPDMPSGITLPSVFTPIILGSDFLPITTGWTEMNVPISPSNITLTWGPVSATGSFYLQLGSFDGVNSVKVILIEARVTSSGGNPAVIKIVDFLRNTNSFNFYLGKKTKITMTNNAPSGSIEVIRMGPPNNLVDAKKVGSGSDVESLQLGGVKKGFYRGIFTASEAGKYTGTFQTDPYPCPYPQGYQDLYGVFKGCSLLRTSPQQETIPHFGIRQPTTVGVVGGAPKRQMSPPVKVAVDVSQRNSSSSRVIGSLSSLDLTPPTASNSTPEDTKPCYMYSIDLSCSRCFPDDPGYTPEGRKCVLKKCASFLTLNKKSGKCECPTGMKLFLSEKTCKCLEPYFINPETNTCECPQSRPFNVTTNTCSCIGKQKFNTMTRKCECPSNRPYNSSIGGCTCIGWQTFNSTTKRCECPANRPYDEAKRTCSCLGDLVFNNSTNNCECPSNTIFNSQTFKCEVPPNCKIADSRDSTRCVSCNLGYVFGSKLETRGKCVKYPEI